METNYTLMKFCLRFEHIAYLKKFTIFTALCINIYSLYYFELHIAAPDPETYDFTKGV